MKTAVSEVQKQNPDCPVCSFAMKLPEKISEKELQHLQEGE